MADTHSPLQRFTLNLPLTTAKRLRELIPARRRTQFVAAAIERELRRHQLRQALAVSSGAWSAADHPDLDTSEAIDAWLEGQRAELAWDPATAIGKRAAQTGSEG